uniref:Uncharacterized protein n=1 Tax=Tanacetum cinerariifolium TaxID=118510 RepID=A0A6L2JK78_TANCI|nr:hypothetical protein [Tanacetum cinerariifolium]
MRIEQYFLITDYSLWEVIINGVSPVPIVVVEGAVQPAAILSADQKLARRNELKARGTLVMALPDKHQLKFNSHKDAKILMEPIEKRFEGNTETKKVQKTLLKQQFENFTGSSSEDLDQIHDRLQKLVSQLEIYRVSLSQEDVNLKFLRSLLSEWKTRTLIWRIKANIEEHGLDDLFNSLRIYEAEVKHSSSPGNPSQNIAFVSSSNTDSTTDSVSAATSVSVVCAHLPMSSHLNINSLSNAMAMLTIRARRFIQKTGINLGDNRVTTMGFDMSKVECYNCHRKGHFTRECGSPKDTRRIVAAEPQRRHVLIETSTSNALVSQCDGIGSYDWSYQAEEEPANFALIAIPSSSSASDNEAITQRVILKVCPQVLSDRSQPSGKYHVVLPPITRNFMPPKPDLVFHTALIAVESAHSAFTVQLKDESEPNDPQCAPSFVQTSEHVKLFGHSTQPVEASILDAIPNSTSSKTNGSSKRKNRKTCFVCRGVDHLIKDCNFHAKPKTQPTPRNSIHRGYDKQYASSTKKYPQKNIVPAAVLTKSKPVYVTAARPVSADVSKIMATKPRHARSLHTKTNSIIRRHKTHSQFSKTSNSSPKVTAAQAQVVSAAKGKNGKWDNPQYALKDKGVIDSGCSRHMTRNMSYFFDFQELNSGYVAFRGNPKGGKILGKGEIKTGLKREFSVPMTPQQNGIAERKNRTLIEAARTMLVDSLLPIPFWAKAVNTVCYVQNMVLVTKPQNKTPYELLHGRTPNIGFMRPFGCLVTILNTFDSLGNFEGKVDEGFLVGYSMNNKAFRVFNSTGPTWLFDIDSLTRTINYQPIIAGNQSNPSAGFQKEFDAGKTGEEADQQYMLFPVWSTGSTTPQNKEGDATFDGKEHNAEKPESTVNLSPSSSALSGEQDDMTKKKDKGKNSSNDVSAAGPIVPTAGQNYSNSTNSISAAESKDIVYSDHENVSAEADFNNLETSITVSPIPTTRIRNAHPISQIIGNLSLTTQTRSMARINRDQGGISQILNEDFHTCMFACFLSQEEPKRVHQALKDPSWIEAMQEKLLQNKKDKRGIVVRNKARLVAQGHTEEEGIDYEEVFAPVARIEAIRLFLAYASFMGFMVYQIDVKSTFLYRTIEEEVYVCQPLGFDDPGHPDKVYKVVKALYGLHQAPRAWYETLATYLLENGFHRGHIDQTLFIKKKKGDILLVQIYVDDIIFGATNKDLCKSFEKLMKDKFQISSMGEFTFFLGLQVKQKEDGIFINQDKYVAEILKKFGLTEGKSASTPIDTEKPLLKDPDGEDVDVQIYRSMIGSLMYLTSSRPDIMFAVCACAHFQVTPKVSHLHAVKTIFRYLKCKPHLGLWYPKDSPFDLVAYSDSDYAVVATSSTEAEYVAGASCCA